MSHQTTRAIIPAGKIKKNTFAIKIMTNIPIINNKNKQRIPINPREPIKKNDMNYFMGATNIKNIALCLENNSHTIIIVMVKTSIIFEIIIHIQIFNYIIFN